METIKDKNETAEPWRPGAQGEYPGSDVVRSGREGFERLSSRVANAVDMARQKMADFRQNGLEKMKGDVVSYTKEQPTNALLVAAGIGALLGILTGLRRR